MENTKQNGGWSPSCANVHIGCGNILLHIWFITKKGQPGSFLRLGVSSTGHSAVKSCSSAAAQTLPGFSGLLLLEQLSSAVSQDKGSRAIYEVWYHGAGMVQLQVKLSLSSCRQLLWLIGGQIWGKIPVPLYSEVRQLKVTQLIMHDASLLCSSPLLPVFQKRPHVVEGLVELCQWECGIMWDMGGFSLGSSELGVGLWCLLGTRTGVYNLPLSNKRKITKLLSFLSGISLPSLLLCENY